MLKKEALLSFPDFEKPFHLYTDASDRQLGATVVQDGKPLGFYTRKLNPAQKNYTVGERELLGIVEGLKVFEGILWGQQVTVHTDHLNLLYKNMPTERMIRWRLLLEEFNPKMVHVLGPENEAADALSRLDMDDNEYDEIEWLPPRKPLTYSTEVRERINLLYPMASEKEMNPDTGFPLATDLIRFYQDQDNKLQEQVDKHPDWYTHLVVEGETLIMKQGKIVIPPVLQRRGLFIPMQLGILLL